MQAKRNPPGIRARHSSRCASRSAGRCNCKPTYEAWVWSDRDQKKIYASFPSMATAKAWRADAQTALRKGTLRAPSPVTLQEAADAWLDGVRAGTIRNRSGHVYKPSAIRSYERALRLRVLPELGRMRLTTIRRADLQDLVDRMHATGIAPSTMRNTLDPLRAIYRRALNRDQVTINPTVGLELPAAGGSRDRIAPPLEARALLGALPDEQRALWATAFYSGLRRGELRALRWSDIDLDRNRIEVTRGWDDEEGEITVKSAAGQRVVPILAALRPELVAHKLRTGRDGEALVFGMTASHPFDPSTVRRRALSAWGKHGMTPIGLHECRHTFASMMIAAGVNAKALTAIMGHATITMTYDRYGHLMPGGEDEAAALVDAYLANA